VNRRRCFWRGWNIRWIRNFWRSLRRCWNIRCFWRSNWNIGSVWRCWRIIRRWLSHSQHHNNQFLTLFTITIFPTNEVKWTRSIKLKLRFTILKLLDRVLLVTFLIIILVHHQHSIRALLVLKNKSITDLEPHPFSPMIVILRRVQNPPIFPTNIESVGLRA